MGEIDWLNSSPAERLLQKQAADRTLHLDENGVLAADIVPISTWQVVSGTFRVEYFLLRKKHGKRRRIDRLKRGLVVPRSPTVKGESAKERVPMSIGTLS